MIVSTIFLPIAFLFGAAALTALKTAFLRLEPKYITRDIDNPEILPFLPFRLFARLFPKERFHPIIDFLALTQLITLVGFAISASFYSVAIQIADFENPSLPHEDLITWGWLLLFALIILIVTAASLALFYLFSLKAHYAAIKLFSFISTVYLLLLFPITFPLLWLKKAIAPDFRPIEPHLSSEKLKKRLQEILHDEEFISRIDPRDKKIVTSLAQFGDLVCREIMVPRVHIECMEEGSTLYDALRVFVEEGYSRLPAYKESIDHMSGVLLYKDAMKHILKNIDQLEESLKKTIIREMITPVIFAPENKKIRDLFHEMRLQRIHAAIIVNEYGCTEGMITIEDILEEIVGSEIQDEHDIDEEKLFQETGDQGWIVDAKMLIIDAERELGISFPHHPQYETIGGYIFHVTGIIPATGSVIHLDQYNIRVLSSDNRQIHKVKISKEGLYSKSSKVQNSSD